MFELLVFLGAGFGGYAVARNFVRQRLRFVDLIHHPATPWVAGIGAAVITWPLAALPLVTTATSAIFGLGTGIGTRSGARSIKGGEGLPTRL